MNVTCLRAILRATTRPKIKLSNEKYLNRLSDTLYIPESAKKSFRAEALGGAKRSPVIAAGDTPTLSELQTLSGEKCQTL